MALLLSWLLLPAFEDVPPVYPQVEIISPRMQVTVYRPDPTAGFYRGTRFDWSGAISSLRWQGHEFFGPWFEQHDPLVHDAITGPVQEFQAGESSVGYAEAAPGGTFLRVGVGHVRKPDEPRYRRFETYEIVEAGTWVLTPGPAAMTFTHTLPDVNGYAYVYRKTLRLEGDTMVLDHALTNTGRKRIDTSVYNHNFFTLDRRQTGPAVSVRFPFEARASRELAPLASLAGRELRFTRALLPRETVFTEVEGFGAGSRDYDFTMAQAETGAAVRIRSDRPLVKMVFWAAPRTVCPEPYVDASVDPGQTSTWRITYEFSEVSRP